MNEVGWWLLLFWASMFIIVGFIFGYLFLIGAGTFGAFLLTIIGHK